MTKRARVALLGALGAPALHETARFHDATRMLVSHDVDGDPYREQEFHEPCERCEAASATVCGRCRVPLCRDHAPRRGLCCDQCELEFTNRLSLVRYDAEQPSHPVVQFLAPMLGLGLAVGVLATLAILGRGAIQIFVFYVTPALLVLSIWALVPRRKHPRISRARRWMIERRLRREFLAEGAQKRSLLPHEDEDEAPQE